MSKSDEQIVAEALSYLEHSCTCHPATPQELAEDAVKALRAAGRLAPVEVTDETLAFASVSVSPKMMEEDRP